MDVNKKRPTYLGMEITLNSYICAACGSDGGWILMHWDTGSESICSGCHRWLAYYGR